MARPIKIQADGTFVTLGTSNPQYDPSLISLANGGYMMGFTDEATLGDPNAWVSTVGRSGIFGQFVTSAANVDEQHVSAAAFDSGAAMAFAWTERNDTTGEFDIYASVAALDRTGSVGANILPRFLVNTGAVAGIQDRPEIVALGSDRFAVAWIDRNAGKVYSAVYDINGGTIFAPAALSVSNSTQGFGSPSARIDIIPINDYQFVVAYRADIFEAKFRIANAIPSIRFATDEIDVDGIAAGNGKSGMAVLSDGRFVIVYQQSDSIKGRIFNPDGTPSTAVFNVSPIVSADSLPQVAAFADGRFMAVMSNGEDIIAQVMHSDGTLDGTPFIANDVLSGKQTRPVISTLADGRVAVGWETNEAGNLDIKYTLFDPRESGVTVLGTGVSDAYVGSRFDDTLIGANGTDDLQGGDGNDLLLGGAGGDSLLGEGGNDELNGGTGADDLNGGPGNDLLDGGGGNDDLAGGSGNDWFVFKPGSGADTIFDFVAGAGSVDKLDLTALHLTLGGVLSRATQAGAHTVINFGNGDTITLQNISRRSLSADDFIGLLPAGPLPVNDFNADGMSDILLRNVSGRIATWEMNGSQIIGSADYGVMNASWAIVGTGDFNNDDASDILWRNSDGRTVIWEIDGQLIIGTPDFGIVDNAWKTVGIGDFNGDGISDILWRHTSGQVSTWEFDDGQIINAPVLGTISSAWEIVGPGDFNGDGISDILLRSNTGRIATWEMNGSQIIGSADYGAVNNSWKVAGTGDFNGDGMSDILWRNETGRVALWLIDGNQVIAAPDLGVANLTWGIEAVGDFNGDGTSDILWRDDKGEVATWEFNNGQISNAPVLGTVSPAWEIIG